MLYTITSGRAHSEASLYQVYITFGVLSNTTCLSEYTICFSSKLQYELFKYAVFCSSIETGMCQIISIHIDMKTVQSYVSLPNNSAWRSLVDKKKGKLVDDSIQPHWVI
jgi:hypothetical protein